MRRIIGIALLLAVAFALLTQSMFIKLSDSSYWQLLGWILVFIGLILSNEFARRTKVGGLTCFIVIPAILSVYFIILEIAGKVGVEWAVNNPTYKYMNGWFHYAKLYAATIGCIGFMMIKYDWSIGKEERFCVFPFIIVSIYIIIAVISVFESGIYGYYALKETGTRWWYSSEGVFKYGGWWNWANGIAGILDIFCMTDWWGLYHSADRADMLWPDMTYVFIIVYDIWNFEYTYNCLPTHSWYCGMALLLAPTVANYFWNKGGWIQNRANTLAIWCMFAQVFPEFQDGSRFSTYSSVYPRGYTYQMMRAGIRPDTIGPANPTMQGIVAALSLVSNIVALVIIFINAKKLGQNPYTNPVFIDQEDYKEAWSKVQIEIDDGYQKIEEKVNE